MKIRKSLNFSRLSFRNCKSCIYNCADLLSYNKRRIILHPTVLIYDFHIFITSSSSFNGFIMNQFNNLLPVDFLAQLVERCTWYRRVQGFESCTSLNFFRLSFRNCKSCVYNCDDLLSYNNSSPRICHYDLHIFMT